MAHVRGDGAAKSVTPVAELAVKGVLVRRGGEAGFICRMVDGRRSMGGLLGMSFFPVCSCGVGCELTRWDG